MPGRFASIIASSQYSDRKLAALSFPEPDLPALARVLRDPEIGNFDQVETAVDLPCAEVCSRIEELFHFRKPYDFLLLYYAGVGLVAEGERLYFAAADTRLESFAQTAIAAEFICGWMNRSFARRQLLIIDCSFVTLVGERPGSQIDVGTAFKGNGRWRMVLVASGATQYALVADSLIGDRRTSTFGDRFLRGLETGDADLDGNGLISVREIFAYVSEHSEKLPIAERPQLWTYSGLDKFVIAAVSERSRRRRGIKWDLVFGAIMVPAVTLLLGWQAEPSFALGAAVFFLLIYSVLYLKGD
jgi:hypothetical protein